MDTIDDIIALYCKYTTDNYNILYSDNNLYIFMHHRWISYESSSLINDFIRWYNTEYLSNYFGTGKIHIVIALLNAINKGDYNITIIDNFTKFYKDNYNSQLNKNSYLIFKYEF